LLSFFENEEITNSLFDSGYSIAKTLMTEYEDELLDDEITKLVTYIYSRLERMEEQIINIEKPAFTKKVDQMIKGYKEGKETTLESVEQTIKKLQDCNSDVRHNLKAKYNRELSRYFKLLKPYYKKHELDADDVNHELAELYVDLAKTYEIINDETYVNASRKHDAQIVELNGILKQLKPSTKKTEKKKKFSVIDIWDNDRLSSIPRGGVADRDGGMM